MHNENSSSPRKPASSPPAATTAPSLKAFYRLDTSSGLSWIVTVDTASAKRYSPRTSHHYWVMQKTFGVPCWIRADHTQPGSRYLLTPKTLRGVPAVRSKAASLVSSLLLKLSHRPSKRALLLGRVIGVLFGWIGPSSNSECLRYCPVSQCCWPNIARRNLTFIALLPGGSFPDSPIWTLARKSMTGTVSWGRCPTSPGSSEAPPP